jgi:hypothetical protein
MGGLVEALLGAGIGASTAAVNNAKHDQQQLDADAAEGRIMNREAALMYLRDKYAKGQAEHADSLARGRAKFENNLRLDSLNDKRVTQAEDRKRQSEIDDYDIKSGIDMEKWTNQNSITHKQALELLEKQQAGQRSLLNTRLAAKGGKSGGADDDELGNPDFVEGRKDLYSYLGIDAGGDESDMRGVIPRLGLPEKATTKDAQEVLKAATYVFSANPNLAPDEALQMGKALAYKKLQISEAMFP